MNGPPTTTDATTPLRRAVVVRNPHGLHMRPATAFAKLARECNGTVLVHRDGTAVNGKSQLELMLLAAEAGTELVVELDGGDPATLDALADLLAAESADDDD